MGNPLRTFTDAEIIGASDGNPDRFGDIFERHYPSIHRYLHRRVGRDLADELASETFVVAFHRRASYDASRPNARPWLFGIASRLLRRHFRVERRKLNAYARTAIDPILATDPALDVADDRLDARALGPALAEAVAALGSGDRDVLLLFAWADLTYRDIAEALNIPIGTVRSRLARARKRVRELIGAQGQELQGRTTQSVGGSDG